MVSHSHNPYYHKHDVVFVEDRGVHSILKLTPPILFYLGTSQGTIVHGQPLLNPYFRRYNIVFMEDRGVYSVLKFTPPILFYLDTFKGTIVHRQPLLNPFYHKYDVVLIHYQGYVSQKDTGKGYKVNGFSISY